MYSRAKILLCIAFLAIFGLISSYFLLIFGFLYALLLNALVGGWPALFLFSFFLNHFMREADGVGVGNLLNLAYSLFLPFFLFAEFRDCNYCLLLLNCYKLSLIIEALFYVFIHFPETRKPEKIQLLLLAFGSRPMPGTRIVHAASRSDDANISLRDHELISLLMKLKQV